MKRGGPGHASGHAYVLWGVILGLRSEIKIALSCVLEKYFPILYVIMFRIS